MPITVKRHPCYTYCIHDRLKMVGAGPAIAEHRPLP